MEVGVRIRRGMKVQVLASVMDETMENIVERMGLDSDAVIINQCGCLGVQETEHRGHFIRFFSFPDRGVGRSRNEAILRADKDICLFSDGDIVYEPGYAEAVSAEFERNPKADMILFNITVEESRRTYHIQDRKRVHWYNCGRYGAVSFAVRRDSLLRSGVTFSLLFGGGAKYSNGEDSLFLRDCLRAGMRIYAVPDCIGEEMPRESGGSTWFHGFTEKFFKDRGVLYYYLYGKLAKVFSLRFLLKNKTGMCGEIPLKKAYRLMAEGIRSQKSIKKG